jgi:predicted PurR-regulated permease PerM
MIASSLINLLGFVAAYIVVAPTIHNGIMAVVILVGITLLALVAVYFTSSDKTNPFIKIRKNEWEKLQNDVQQFGSRIVNTNREFQSLSEIDERMNTRFQQVEAILDMIKPHLLPVDKIDYFGRKFESLDQQIEKTLFDQSANFTAISSLQTEIDKLVNKIVGIDVVLQGQINELKNGIAELKATPAVVPPIGDDMKKLMDRVELLSDVVDGLVETLNQ